MTWTQIFLHPAFILIAGAFLLALLPKLLRQAGMLILPLLALGQIVRLHGQDLSEVRFPFLSYQFLPFHQSDYSFLFAFGFGLVLLFGSVFALHKRSRLEIACGFVAAGCAIGVTMAGDWLLLMMYWEGIAVSSTALIWLGHSERSGRVGFRYGIFHAIGGALMFAGIAAQIGMTDSLQIMPLALENGGWQWHSSLYANNPDIYSVGVWLILAGVMVNLSIPPFCNILTDAYPSATPSGMVWLASFASKTAIFVLLTYFTGVPYLVETGIFMLIYGIAAGLFEQDMRKILAHAVLSQLGLMLMGIGVGTEEAKLGVALLAFAHMLYQTCFFMSAGIVQHHAGHTDLRDLGHLWRSLPLAGVCSVLAGLALCAFPFTVSYLPKSILSEAMINSGYLARTAMVAAAGMSLIYAGLRIPYFAFFSRWKKGEAFTPAPVPENMQIAILAATVICLLFGFASGKFLPVFLPAKTLLPEPVATSPLLHQLSVLQIAGLAFLWLIPVLRRLPVLPVRFDWIYRFLMKWALILLEKLMGRVYTYLKSAMQHGVRKLLPAISLHFAMPPRPSSDVLLEREDTLRWLILLLAIMSLFYWLG